MSQHHTHEITGIHKAPLYGALGVVIFALVLVVGAVLAKDDKAVPADVSVEERSLYFLDAKNGVVAVYDAATRTKLGSFSKGEGAFVRISMRSLMRQRVLKEVDLNLPFKLIKTAKGDLKITDPASGEAIRVNAFGPLAIESFARFLPTNHSKQGAQG